LTGQDIAEAHGAVTSLLERSLARVDANRYEYVFLRVLTARGPYASPAELHRYLAGQPQVGLSPEETATVLAGLERRGLASGTAPDSAGPARATAEGAALLARLTQEVAPRTRQLYAGLAAADLAIAHRVLAELTKRAEELTEQASR
jgi:hypothetical protein